MLKYQNQSKGLNAHNLLAEKLNKISLSFNDQKTLHSFIGVKLYLYWKMMERYAKMNCYILKQKY